MQSTSKAKILLGIKKAQGVLNKVQKMIESDVYCADIAQQVNASIGLLKNANMELLEHHLMCCGTKNLSSSNPQKVQQFVKELIKVRDVSTRK